MPKAKNTRDTEAIKKQKTFPKKWIMGDKMPSLELVHAISTGHVKVTLSKTAIQRIDQGRKFLLKCANSGETFYGVNTGFGPLSSVRVEDKDLEALQMNLLRSHAVGTGDPIEPRLVKKMILLRALALTQGNSGVSSKLVLALVALLNSKVIPWIPEQGSVGASGDLCPLAHLALVLIGEGHAYVDGQLMPGARALKLAGLKPIKIGAKEGLALINGTQMMLAFGIEALLSAENLVRNANLASAMTIEAFRGTATAFDPLIHELRPHPGQVWVASEIKRILGGNKPSDIAKSHEGCGRVQDPYSLRCIPQVHGATVDTLNFVRTVLETELGSVTDNPLVFPKQGKILSGGNFHGQILAMSLDFLAIAVAELANISERRIEKLTNPATSELPAFLIPRSGLNSGFMIVQYAAASIVSENKTLCHPASVDSIPTSANKEDHVSMGAWAARKALKVCENTRRVLAMEWISATQGIELLRPLKTSSILESQFDSFRKIVKFRREDASFYEDIARAVEWTRQH